jgi:hypothetical protein
MSEEEGTRIRQLLGLDERNQSYVGTLVGKSGSSCQRLVILGGIVVKHNMQGQLLPLTQ